MTNLAAEKLAVAKEVARLGLSFTKPNEVILTAEQFFVLIAAADAAYDHNLVDRGELDRVSTELRERLDRSCVVYQFQPKAH
jgi:hypothetical protein